LTPQEKAQQLILEQLRPKLMARSLSGLEELTGLSRSRCHQLKADEFAGWDPKLSVVISIALKLGLKLQLEKAE
jgi:hypothetical protein